MTEEKNLKRELGLAAAISIVIGNTIGSGIFLAPQNLAAVTTPALSLVAWIITICGSLLIAINFANMGTAIPKTGGSVAYTMEAFGEAPAFIVSWMYWIGQWTGVAALITASMRFLSVFVPSLKTNNVLAFIISSIILWILTYVNIRGAKNGAIVQIVTTVCKILPFIIFIAVAIFHFNPSLFHTVSPEVAESGGGISTLPSAIAITMWIFIGIESATITGDEIKNPEKIIKKSTIWGTLIVAGIYLLVSILAMGILPQSALSKSTAPIADMLNYMTGSTIWGGIISFGILISALGCTNGTILVCARVSFAAAKENLFPKIFGKVHPKYHTPSGSLIISGIVTNILLLMNYSKGLNAAYVFILLLSTLSYLVAYLASALCEIVLLKNRTGKITIGSFIKNSILPFLAFAYILYAVYGCGAESVMWGFMLILFGFPFYLYQKVQNNKNISNSNTLNM